MTSGPMPINALPPERRRKPTRTIAEIPAGQGAASLYITPDSDGTPRVYYKHADGDITAWSYSADSRHEPVRAMWEHLAATLPTVSD